jgi:serine phosphatase RsbU (regulator of sigma subunit)
MATACDLHPRILVADDQPDLIDAVRLLLKSEGIQVDAASSPEAALAALKGASFDLLLMDLNYTNDTTSGREGIDLLSRVQAIDRLLPVIVMTGWGSVDLAVEAMRRGVRDFVQKPWDNTHLISTLRNEIDEGRSRRQQHALEQRELDEARRIQRQLMPAAIPQLDGFEIVASWQPAGGVGGDCYDAIAFGPSRVALSIADVEGKGIPAALLMSNLQAAVRAFATASAQPVEIALRVNRVLCGHAGEDRLISFFYCYVDADEGMLTYVNAGHFPPVLVRADGTIERLSAGGPVLGVLSDGAYVQERTPIKSGDRLVLYTDGIIEAVNANGEMFSDERLIDLVVANRACSAPALQARLTEAVAGHTDGRLQDDATLIVMAAD